MEGPECPSSATLLNRFYIVVDPAARDGAAFIRHLQPLCERFESTGHGDVQTIRLRFVPCRPECCSKKESIEQKNKKPGEREVRPFNACRSSLSTCIHPTRVLISLPRKTRQALTHERLSYPVGGHQRANRHQSRNLQTCLNKASLEDRVHLPITLFRLRWHATNRFVRCHLVSNKRAKCLGLECLGAEYTEWDAQLSNFGENMLRLLSPHFDDRYSDE